MISGFPEQQPEQEIASLRVRQVLDRLFRDGQAVARSDGTVHHLFPVAIGPAEGAALRSWVIREAAARTIEIGLGYGISALILCEGLLASGHRNVRHIVIDPHQGTRFADCGLQLLAEAGVSRLVKLYAEESQIALPRLLSEGTRFDFAFVDGDHHFDAVFLDLFYLGRLLRPHGVVFADDYHLPGVARAASFFVKNLGWVLEEVSAAGPQHHWAVLRTSEESGARPFDYFVDF